MHLLREEHPENTHGKNKPRKGIQLESSKDNQTQMIYVCILNSVLMQTHPNITKCSGSCCHEKVESAHLLLRGKKVNKPISSSRQIHCSPHVHCLLVCQSQAQLMKDVGKSGRKELMKQCH